MADLCGTRYETFMGFRIAIRLLVSHLLEEKYAGDPDALDAAVKLIMGGMDHMAIGDIGELRGEMVKHYALQEVEDAAAAVRKKIVAQLPPA